MSNRSGIFRHATALLGTTALVAVTCASPAAAGNVNWVGANTSNWQDGSNWSGSSVPTTGDTVTIDTQAAHRTVQASGIANAGTLIVGDTGSADLSVRYGSGLSVLGSTTIGNQAGSNGTLTVSNTGSILTVGVTPLDAFNVGVQGVGTLNVQTGGAVVTSGAMTVGSLAGGQGTVTVDGAGSSLQVATALAVGRNSTGTLTISNGGAVTVGDNFSLGFNGDGHVTVTGAGSALKILGNDFFVGTTGNVTVDITNGAMLSSKNIITVGNDIGQAAVTVDGQGSTVNARHLYVGSGSNSQTVTMTATNGGVINGGYGVVGFASASKGLLGADGAGSSLNYNATFAGNSLIIGQDGHGTAYVSNGGSLTAAGNIVIAQNSGSFGSLVIGSTSLTAPAAPGTVNAPAITFGSGAGWLVFNHTSTGYTFATPMSGNGRVINAAGHTILTGNSSAMTGQVLVNGGILTVDGSLAGAPAQVNSGGTLGGVGAIGNLQVNAGSVFAPGSGAAGSSMTVGGNLAFQAGAAYLVQLNASTASFAHVTGTATLTGAQLVVNAPSGIAAPFGTRYTVLTADGGVSGRFAGVSGLPASTAFLSIRDTYDTNHAYLAVQKSRNFADAGLTPNQIATAHGLDSLGPGPLTNAVAALSTDAQARAAFDQLSGEAHASMKTALIEDSHLVRDAAIDRLRAAFDTVGAVHSPVMSYADAGPMLAPATTDRFAVWSQGFGSWGHTDSDGNAARLKRSTGGFLVGGDGLAFDNWRFGALAGYSRSDINVRDRSSSGSSDNYHAGLYGGTQWGNLAFRSGAAYSWHDISTSRSVVLPGFADRLTGSTHAGLAQAFGELGYGLRFGQIAIEPFANLAYVSLTTDDVRENGGAAALSTMSGTTDTTFTTLGLRTSSDFTLGGLNATARGTLGWQHAFGDVTPVAMMTFAGSAPFTIAGVPIARDAALVETGINLSLIQTATLGLSYSGQLASSAQQHTFKANLNVKF
ncbi:MAG: autotransporter domain-containing protein [Pseudomonadota bacterium]